MTTSTDLQGMLVRGDQVYFGLVAFAALLCWLGFLAWRTPGLRARLLNIRVNLPDLSLPAIVLIALLVRIPLMYDSLWYDEAFTAQIASVPFGKLATAIMGDVHPPIWYAVEWVWTRMVGTSEFALRFPSLVLGLALILLAYRMGKALGLSVTVTRLACLIIALLPAPAYYATEARGYALLACLAFTMVIAIAENRPRWFLIAGVLICWTHNLGFVYLGVLGAYAAFGYQWPPKRIYWKRLFQWLVLPGAIASLWLPFMLQQSKAIADGFWIEPFSPGMGLRVITDETLSRKFPDAIVLPVYLIILALTLLSLWEFRSTLFWRNRRGALIALIVGVPLMTGVVSVVWHPVYLTRALLPCGVGLAFLWAYALSTAQWGNVMRALAAPALVVSVACSFIPNLGRENVRDLLAPCYGVQASYGTSIPAAVFLRYYVDAPLLNWPGAGDLNQTLTPATKDAIGLVSGDVSSLHGDVCIAALDTPNTTDAERTEVRDILARYPHATIEASVSPIYAVRIYRVSLGEKSNELASAAP